jgi:hypothetical protein
VIARNARVAGIAAVAAVVIGGCGSGSGSGSGGAHHAAHKTSHAASAPSQTAPTRTTTLPSPGPTRIPADPTAVRVIQGWANALRNGDLLLAAHYFALPSEMVNGGGANGVVVVFRIHTIAQAVYANATLPCGATFLSADRRGRFVNALFRLSGRRGPGGTSCGAGAGQTARTNFVISGGRIVEWVRAPDDPGDNHTPAQPAPSTPTTGNSGPVA